MAKAHGNSDSLGLTSPLRNSTLRSLSMPRPPSRPPTVAPSLLQASLSDDRECKTILAGSRLSPTHGGATCSDPST